ncbi:MAG: hypothetical protein E6G56_04400 [Actinobacteria bacterium]|nr:MAG: hypothetical protein E6G56_04400 [Actinomycetota bacterium]
MSTAALRVLSLGAGVQSTALLLLVLAGEVKASAALFADTGWEPRAVYDHLERLKGLCAEHGLPLYVVSNGNIRNTREQDSFYHAPYYLTNSDGSEGMSRRQCTHQLKIVPIRRKIRELMAERGIAPTPGAVECLMGISLDEWHRMKDADVRYIVNRWPLVERRWTRADCKQHLADQGWEAPRSACIGCPYHSNTEWRALRDGSPDEWQDAIRFEQEIQATGAALRGTPYLHAQRVPLPMVDLSTPEDRGQLTLDAECEAMCGV